MRKNKLFVFLVGFSFRSEEAASPKEKDNPLGIHHSEMVGGHGEDFFDVFRLARENCYAGISNNSKREGVSKLLLSFEQPLVGSADDAKVFPETEEEIA